MKLRDYLATWHGTRDENTFHRRSNLVLLFVCVLLLVALLTKGHTVVLVPPELHAEGRISANRASPEVRTAWALYYATLIGNVTPANVEFLSKNLAPGLTPRLYHEVSQALIQQARQVQAEQITTRFEPGPTYIIPSTGHVLVVGSLVTEGVRGNSERSTRTYEFGFEVSNYRVLLDSMEIHNGEYTPRDAEKNS